MRDIPWTWLAIRASGITAWALLTAVVAWGMLLRSRLLGGRAAPVGLLGMHRWLGALALGALAVHLGLLLVDPAVRFTPVEILIPFTAPWQPVAVAFGIAAFWTLIPVTVVGRFRHRVGKRGNTVFKRAHLAAYIAWPLATAHYILAGTDALTWWGLGVLATGTTVLVFLLFIRGLFVPERPARAPRPVTPAGASAPGPAAGPPT